LKFVKVFFNGLIKKKIMKKLSFFKILIGFALILSIQ